MIRNEPGTVTLGATPVLNTLGQHVQHWNPKSRKLYPAWNMPKPLREVPHWINPKKRAEAEAKGLDRMTAGVKYTIMVPIYRGLSCRIFNSLKNNFKRKKLKRWSN